MTKNEWMHLKSGTDVRGVAVETDTESVELTDDVVMKICHAFYDWFCEKEMVNNFSVAVGHDCRISSDRIQNAAMKAFCECGCKVYDCSLASTPSMFMSIVDNEDITTALEITASHHPYMRNGLKFFTKNGGLEGSDVSEILERAMNDKPRDIFDNSPIKFNFMSRYCEILRNRIIDDVNLGDKPLAGLHIVVDAGNGVGGFYATDVLEPLGANIDGSRFLEPDGMFPNHIPNPENKDAIKSASDMVIESKADFGLIFDTDVDRMGCISADGKEINRNSLVALAAAVALEENIGGTVVTDSLTSDGLRDFIENELGGKQLRFKRGYKNVIDKSIELNEKGINSPLAIETSGHAALRENYFLDDGAYLATKMVIKLAKLRQKGMDIEKLISNLKEPAQSIEIRIPIMLEDFKPYGEMVISELEQFALAHQGWNIEKENYEGIRINLDGGWFLLRLSVHDPILPLNIENDNFGACDNVANELKMFFEHYNMLDLSGFNK